MLSTLAVALAVLCLAVVGSLFGVVLVLYVADRSKR